MAETALLEAQLPLEVQTRSGVPRGAARARALDTPTALARTLDRQGRRALWVARQIQVHRNTVSRWVNGREAIPPARVTQLAELLSVEAWEIAERAPMARPVVRGAVVRGAVVRAEVLA